MRSSAAGSSRSSSAQTPPRASSSCPDDGSSRGPSPGSTDAVDWPRIGRNQSPPHRHGFLSPTSDSSQGGSQGTVIKHRVSSRTLSTAGAITFDATTAGEGVVIVQGTTPSDRGGRGFSHFFGMNDLLQSLVEPHFDTGFATTSAHGFGVTGITTIQLRGPNSENAVSFTLDFSTVGGTAFSDVLTSLNTGFAGFGTWALDANGALTFTPVAGLDGSPSMSPLTPQPVAPRPCSFRNCSGSAIATEPIPLGTSMSSVASRQTHP